MKIARLSAPVELTMTNAATPSKAWAYIRHSCKIDVLLLIVVCIYVISPNSILRDRFIAMRLFNNIPRAAFESINLVILGLVERCLVLPLLSFLDREGYTSNIRFPSKRGAVPDLDEERETLRKDVSKFPGPLLQNKNALIMTMVFVLPIDCAKNTGPSQSIEQLSLKSILASVLMGLIIIDFVLGTAHLVSHQGVLKKWFWPLHARHHKKNYNYAAVKFFGEEFDLEVFLTQVCYAFLSRILGFDVVTGTIMINWFSFQLLLEHSGYNLFYVAVFHETHHRYGNVAFYHFPLWECLFGKMPSAVQVEEITFADQRLRFPKRLSQVAARAA